MSTRRKFRRGNKNINYEICCIDEEPIFQIYKIACTRNGRLTMRRFIFFNLGSERMKEGRLLNFLGCKFSPFPSRFLFYLFLDILCIVFLQFLSNVDLKTFKDKNVKILEAKIHRVYIEMLFECEVMDDGMRKVWDRFSVEEHRNFPLLHTRDKNINIFLYTWR